MVVIVAMQELPAGGLAVIMQGPAIRDAVHIAVALGSGPGVAGTMVPALAVQRAGTDEVISTSSLAPTFVRVFGVPSGAAANVRVVIVQTRVGGTGPGAGGIGPGAGGGGAGVGGDTGGAGAGVKVAWETGPGSSSTVYAVWEPEATNASPETLDGGWSLPIRSKAGALLRSHGAPGTAFGLAIGAGLGALGERTVGVHKAALDFVTLTRGANMGPLP